MARTLIRKTQQVARNSGISWFTIFSDRQVGNNFGERLANALESVLAQGFERVIVIGNDCPDLNPAHLRRAEKLLQSQDWVLGPDRRGGLYLIGVHAAAYDRERFMELPWQHADLCTAFRENFSGIAWMPALSDLNTSVDVRRFLRLKSFGNRLKQQLSALLEGFKIEYITDFPAIRSQYIFSVRSLRAPPL